MPTTLTPTTRCTPDADTWFWRLLTLHVVVWTALPILLRPTLPIDALEGVVWGQHLILGYDRNPWLNAWLTRLAIELGGASGWLTYLFSQLLVALCFWSVWRLGRKFLQPLHVFVAVFMLEGIQYYSIASIDFNDNVLELGLWPLLILLFYRAVTLEKLRDWFGVGLVAGLALMAKYYTVFLLAGLLLFLLVESQARQSFNKRGLYIAGAVFLAIITPHFIWLAQHDFVTLHYAQNRIEKGRLFTAWDSMQPALRFGAIQLVNVLGALLLLLAILSGKKSATENLTPRRAVSRFDQRFLLTVTFTPLLLTVLLAMMLGWRLYTLWGMPLLSLSGLIILVYGQPVMSKAAFYRFLGVVIFVIVATATAYAVAMSSKTARGTFNYPSRAVASAVQNIWRARYHRSLRYIAGDRYSTFYVAVYATDKPAAYVDWDASKSPWIDEQLLRTTGAIFIQPQSHGTQFTLEIRQRFPTLQILPKLVIKRINASSTAAPIVLLLGVVPPRA